MTNDRWVTWSTERLGTGDVSGTSSDSTRWDQGLTFDEMETVERDDTDVGWRWRQDGSPPGRDVIRKGESS